MENLEQMKKRLKKLEKIESFFVTLLLILSTLLVMTSLIYFWNKPHPYDLNNDGTVDIKDLLKLQKHLIEKEEK